MSQEELNSTAPPIQNDDGKEKTTKKKEEEDEEEAREEEEDPARTSEREEDGKVLDSTTTTTHAIVCSFCGLPETATRNFAKSKCPCKSTQYCDTTCQRKHWLDHKKNCKHLIAERKRKNLSEKEQRECDANETGVVDSFTNTEMVEEEPHDPMLKKHEEEVNDNNSDGKGNTARGQPKKEEEEGDECPICLEVLPNDATQFDRWTCCGNGIHKHCFTDMKSMNMGHNCPFCRAKTPSSHEEQFKYLRPWVKKKKAWAQVHMASMYVHGLGVKQSYKMARILYEQAAQQGYLTAMCHLGQMYAKGRGVEVSYEKAFEYYKQSAHLGDAKAQFNLGCMYAKGEGVEQNMVAAMKWAKKAAAQGNENAIAQLQRMK